MKRSERIGSHWLWAALAILAAAALAIPQLDDYPPSLDSIDSYGFSFGLTESVWTAEDLVNALYKEIPDQTAPYYLLLHYWGALAGQSLAAGRLISLFGGLLSLAMLYRLSRDFVSPFAALLAVFILLSSAFYAFFYAQLRYYTLQVFLSALVLWLYLRIVARKRAIARRDLAALALACCAVVSIHAFGLLMYIALSPYHLLAVRKDRLWLQVVVAAIGALILALSAIYPMLTDGVARATEVMEAAGAIEVTGGGPARQAGWHLLGTARMGDDPETSVVNSWGRSHDVKNLFIVDGSIFVTSGGVNPTSTIQALALYIADTMKKNLANLFD